MKRYEVILTEAEMGRLKRIFSNEYILVDYIDKSNYKKYVGRKVNVRGYVNLSGLDLRKIPITFGKVDGNFYCYHNRLVSLKGCPSKAGGDFFCYNNSLISLNGSPTEVAGDFDCCNNKLTSLNGCPREVVGDFSCYANKKKFAKYDVKRFCKVIGNIFNI